MSGNFLWRDGADVSASSQEEIEATTVAYRASHEQSSEGGVYRMITRWIVAIGVFLLPLFFLPWTSSILETNKQLLLVVTAGVGMVTWLLGVVLSGQMVVRFNAIDRGVLALLGATTLATVLSASRMRSVFGHNASSSESLVTMIALGVLYFLVVNAFDDSGKKIRSILTASFVVALVFGVLQMLTLYVFPISFMRSRAFNTVGSLNTLGVLAALALPWFLKTRLAFPKLPYLDFAKVGLIAAVAVLAIMNWWVLWTIAIAGLLAIIAFDSVVMSGSSKGGFRISRFVVPMTLIVLSVFLMIVKFNVAPVKSQLPVEVAPSYGLSWKLVKSTSRENIISGYGPENFNLVFDRHGAGDLANTTFSDVTFFDSTSQLMNFLVDGGAVMLLALTFVLWMVGWAITKLVQMRTDIPDREGTSAAVAGTVAALAAVALYPLNHTLMLVWFMSMALLALAVWGRSQQIIDIEERANYSLASSLGFIGGLILVLAGGYFLTTRYIADVHFAKAAVQVDTVKAREGFTKAVNWNGSEDRYYRALSQKVLDIVQQEVNKTDTDAQRPQRVKNYIDQSVGFAKQATDLSPRDAVNWLNNGLVYQRLAGVVDGVEKLAEDSLVKALELRPGDASFYNRIGTIYLSRADLMDQVSRTKGADVAKARADGLAALKKSEDNFKKAVEISANYGLAIYNLGAVYDRQGKLAESITQLEKIIPFNTNQPNLLFELGLLYYRVGRKDDAGAAFQQTLLVAPQFANARWYLALLLEERKDINNAIVQLEKILETNKDNTTVMNKIAELRQGVTQIPPEKLIDQEPL